MLYINLMVTTNQKSIIDTHTQKKTKKKKNPHTTLQIVIKSQGKRAKEK